MKLAALAGEHVACRSSKNSLDGDVERERDLVARAGSRRARSPRAAACTPPRSTGGSGAKPPSSPSPVDEAALLQQAAQRVVRLGAPAQRLGEAHRADRREHELLEVDVAVGVGAAVQHVHQRHRQHVRVGAADVAVQRHARLLGDRLRRRQAARRGSRWRRGGPCCRCRRARSSSAVERPLVGGVEADDGVADLAVHVLDGVAHALAAEAVAAVAQLDGLVGAGARAARDRGPAPGARDQLDLDLDGRVAAGVEDLPPDDVLDDAHEYSCGPCCECNRSRARARQRTCRSPRRPLRIRQPARAARPSSASAATRSTPASAASCSIRANRSWNRRAQPVSADSPSMPARAPATASAASASPSACSSATVAARRRAGFEADRRRLAQQLLHVQQRGQAGRDALDERVVSLLGLLDLLPVRDDRVGACRRRRRRTRAGAGARAWRGCRSATSAIVNAPASAASTEWIITWNSRSPSSSSSASYAPGGDVAAGRVGRQLVDRLRDLVRLFEHVTAERVMRLRRVPRAAARAAQPLGERDAAARARRRRATSPVSTNSDVRWSGSNARSRSASATVKTLLVGQRRAAAAPSPRARAASSSSSTSFTSEHTNGVSHCAMQHRAGEARPRRPRTRARRRPARRSSDRCRAGPTRDRRTTGRERSRRRCRRARAAARPCARRPSGSPAPRTRPRRARARPSTTRATIAAYDGVEVGRRCRSSVERLERRDLRRASSSTAGCRAVRTNRTGARCERVARGGEQQSAPAGPSPTTTTRGALNPCSRSVTRRRARPAGSTT